MALLGRDRQEVYVRSGGLGLGRWLILAAVLATSVRGVEAQPDPEHQIEAVFLYHFTQFVTWPPPAFGEALAPLVIGVLGEDPFGEFLDEVVRGETVNGRPLEVQRYGAVEEVEQCHILFVGRDVAERLGWLLPHLNERPILTVSEADDFARRGGMIQFFQERGKIRLRINVDAARASDLEISSKLLQLADIVRTGRS